MTFFPQPPFSFEPYISKVGGEENIGSTLTKYSPTVGNENDVKFGRTTNVNLKYNCITFIKEYEDKSLEELRFDYYTARSVLNEAILGRSFYRGRLKAAATAAPASNPRPPLKKTGAALVYEVLSKRFETKIYKPKKRCGVGEEIIGTSLVKYVPKVETDAIFKRGQSEFINVKVICITAMKEYEDKSLEELRLEDYRAGRRLLTKYNIKNFDETDAITKPNIFVFGLKQKYVFSFRDNEQTDVPCQREVSEQSRGTTLVKYKPIEDSDVIVKRGTTENIIVKLNCITAMMAYKDKCIEELRLEDYRAGRKPHTKYTNSLRFHSVHGEGIRLSNDRTAAERTNSHYGGIAYSSRPIRVNEKIYLRIVTISNIWDNSGIFFGFTTDNPSGKAHSLPTIATYSKNSWITNLKKELWCLYYKDTILHYYVNSSGELHFGLNDQIQSEILTGVDISRPLWAIINVYGRCKEVQFVGPEALDGVRCPQPVVDGARGPNQVVDSARRPNQSQIEDRARQSVDCLALQTQVENGARQSSQTKVENGARCSNQSQIVDGARQSNQVVDGARQSNQVVDGARQSNQVENGAIRSNQVVDGARQSNQVEDGARHSNQVVDGARQSNQVEDGARQSNNQVVDGARQSNQVEDGARQSNNQVVDGARQSNQVEIGARRSNQVIDRARQSNQVVDEARQSNQVENGARRSNQLVDGARQSNQVVDGARQSNQVEDGARHSNQVVDRARQINQDEDGARRPNASQVEDDPLLNRLRSLSVAEPLPNFRYNDTVPLYLHRTKGRNVHFTGKGIAARYPGQYCQGYVFTARPMPQGKTITVKILDLEDNPGSLAIGLTSCDPAGLRPDELPDDAEFLLDRPEYWVVYLDAANGLQIGDELDVTLTRDGKMEVARNGSDPVAVIHVDNSLKLWAFFDIYGATQEVKLVLSKGVRCRDAVDRIRRSALELEGARHSDPVLDGARHSDPVLDAARQPDPVLDEDGRSEEILDGFRRLNKYLEGLLVTKNDGETPENLPSTSKCDLKKSEKSRTECKICFDKQINSVLYKCGHMCMCYDCAIQQWKNIGKSYGKCPLCRATITDVIRTYTP